MIIIAGTISVHADKRDAFLEAAKDCMAGTRAEEGNEEYVFSADPNDPTLVRLFEIWDSKSRLAAHGKADHMAAFGKATKGMATGRDIAIYDVDGVTPL